LPRFFDYSPAADSSDLKTARRSAAAPAEIRD
jgi:hypothetical protein